MVRNYQTIVEVPGCDARTVYSGGDHDEAMAAYSAIIGIMPKRWAFVQEIDDSADGWKISVIAEHPAGKW